MYQAQFDAVELITQRELVSKKISTDLTIRAKQFGILLDDIAIVCLHTFPSIDFALKFIMYAIKISMFVTDGCVDSPGFWQGVHGRCGAEAGGSAGGREGAIRCGEGGWWPLV
jgi:hypothetical protein